MLVKPLAPQLAADFTCSPSATPHAIPVDSHAFPSFPIWVSNVLNFSILNFAVIPWCEAGICAFWKHRRSAQSLKSYLVSVTSTGRSSLKRAVLNYPSAILRHYIPTEPEPFLLQYCRTDSAQQFSNLFNYLGREKQELRLHHPSLFLPTLLI